MRTPNPYWNTNVARHPGILRQVPPGCGDALDVGCRDGLPARKLAARVPRVTGVDCSPEMIARARGLSAERPALRFLQGDFLTADLPAEGYDFICSVTLVVVGLAREKSAGEWAAFLAAAPVMRVTKAVRRATTPEGMPVADAEMSYGEVRASARELLPGVRYRLHVLRRYSLTGRK